MLVGTQPSRQGKGGTGRHGGLLQYKERHLSSRHEWRAPVVVCDVRVVEQEDVVRCIQLEDEGPTVLY